MAAPRNTPQRLTPAGTAGRESYGVWLYNFLTRARQKEDPQVQEKGVPAVQSIPQSSKDVIRDDSPVENSERSEEVDMDRPPQLSAPLPLPVSLRHTPPRLSPAEAAGLQAAHYDAPCSGAESEASFPDSPHPQPECWKYQLLPTSERSPTAIRARLTRSVQDDDDSHDDDDDDDEGGDFSPEENCSSEDAEDTLWQQDDL